MTASNEDDQSNNKLAIDFFQFLESAKMPVTVRPRLPRIGGNDGFEIVMGWGADTRLTVSDDTTLAGAVEKLLMAREQDAAS